jgi:hypothetical protein
MPSLPAITIYIFGITALLAGARTLLFSSSALADFSLPIICEVPVLGTGCAAVAMGVYYCLLASQENTAFFIATVPVRTLTTIVFLRQGGAWTTAGIWEGAGAALTAGALILQRRK